MLDFQLDVHRPIESEMSLRGGDRPNINAPLSNPKKVPYLSEVSSSYRCRRRRQLAALSGSCSHTLLIFASLHHVLMGWRFKKSAVTHVRRVRTERKKSPSPRASTSSTDVH